MNVWWDQRNSICFSGAETRSVAGASEFHFNDYPESFLVRKWGAGFVRRQIRGLASFEALARRASSEAIYGEIPALTQVRDKSVLIVLAGPSTDQVAWERLDVDFIWSCNRFYQHPKLRRLPLALVGLAPNIPLRGNTGLEAYLGDTRQTAVFFELQKVHDFAARDGMHYFVRRHSTRCTYVHLRYASYLGLGSRLICLAALLGARDIYFVGFDGMSEAGPRHTFEPGKSNPTWYVRNGADVQRRQIVIFWDYILSLTRPAGVRLHNLAEAAESNPGAVIAGMQFPLSASLLQAVAPT